MENSGMNIKSIDDRGWYIATYDGVKYLYSDGVIRDSVSASPSPDVSRFWPTHNDAQEFLGAWFVGNDELYGKALELQQCAQSWEPDVRLLGNVKASEINALMEDYLKLRLKAGILT